jgi:hypothetical protein
VEELHGGALVKAELLGVKYYLSNPGEQGKAELFTLVLELEDWGYGPGFAICFLCDVRLFTNRVTLCYL